jgi:hypothetical protein
VRYPFHEIFILFYCHRRRRRRRRRCWYIIYSPLHKCLFYFFSLSLTLSYILYVNRIISAYERVRHFNAGENFILRV